MFFATGNKIVEYHLEKWNVIYQKSYDFDIQDFEYDPIEKRLFILFTDGSLISITQEKEAKLDLSICSKLESSKPLKLKLDTEEG